ncbi:hypothetical protein Q647_01372 [Bartonella quintana JK 7]|nr:hypothetical protein Q647_01372 [Bartonella quintana JK 7]
MRELHSRLSFFKAGSLSIALVILLSSVSAVFASTLPMTQEVKYTDERIKNITVDAIDDAVSQAKDYTDMRFEALNYGIEGARKEARQAAAIGLAVSNLRYNDTPGKLSIAFGSGLWRSQGAFAFGAGYTSESGAIRSNLSVTSSGGHWGIGAGLGLTLN